MYFKESIQGKWHVCRECIKVCCREKLQCLKSPPPPTILQLVLWALVISYLKTCEAVKACLCGMEVIKRRR